MTTEETYDNTLLAQAVRALSAVCDGAAARDTQGFNKPDSNLGHALAALDPQTWPLAHTRDIWLRLAKYRRQLESMGLSYESIPAPPALEGERTMAPTPGEGLSVDVAFSYQDELGWPLKQALGTPQVQWDRARRVWVVSPLRGSGARLLAFAQEHGFTLAPGTQELCQRIDSSQALPASHRVLLEGQTFVLIFPKDYTIINAVKSLPRRRWNPEAVRWEVPAIPENAKPFAALVKEYGFSLNPPAQEMLDRLLSPATPQLAARRLEINPSGGFRLISPFDPAFVDAFKAALPSTERTWNKTERIWTVTATPGAVQRLLEFAASHNVHVPAAVQQAAERVVQQHKENLVASRAESAELEIPGFGSPTLQLFPFQKAGVKYAAKVKTCLLADQQGIGKTCQALGTVSLLNAFPVLIVCPASLKLNWQREVERWVHGKKVVVLNGVKPSPIDGQHEIVIINYDVLHAWIPVIKQRKWGAVICDESMYIKERKSRRTKAVLELKECAPVRLLLSGTPIKSRPAEIVTQLEFLDRIKEFGGSWKFLQYFCLPGDAPILMSDLSEKSIADVTIGDKIVGWARDPLQRYTYQDRCLPQRRLVEATVLNVLQKTASLQRVTLSDGTQIVCTPDHRWLTGRSESDGEHIEFREAVAPTGTRTQGRGRGLGSSVVRILPSIGEDMCSDDYKRGYLMGLFRGDGWCSRLTQEIESAFRQTVKRGIKGHRVGVACLDTACIDRAEKYLIHFGLTPHRKLRGEEHRLDVGNAGGYEFFTEQQPDSDDWWAGFLGGIYDAEGCGQIISQYMDINPITYDLIYRGLERFKIAHTRSSDRKTIRIIGGRREFTRFWSIATPALRRKLRAYCFNGGGKFMSERLRVVNIAPIPGEHTVYTLTTTTGNYVAYGLGSKNCGAHNNGWGWQFDGAAHLDELNERMRGSFLLRRTKAQVMKELPPKLYSDVPLELSNRAEYQRAERDLIGYLAQEAVENKEFVASIAHLSPGEQREARRRRAEEAQRSAERAEHLVRFNALRQLTARGKIKAALDWATDFLEGGEEKLVLFAHFREAQKGLLDGLAAYNPAHISGDDSTAVRQANVDRFQNDPECRVIVCSLMAAGMGWTLTAASSLAMIDMPWTPGEAEQAHDRIHRISQQADTVNIYTLVAERTIDEHMAQILDTKRAVVDATTDGPTKDKIKNQSIMGDLVDVYLNMGQES